MSYSSMLGLDLLVLFSCGGLLLRYGRLSHSHPAVIYLFFHIYMVTLRLLGLVAGAPTLFSGWGPEFFPLTEREMIRAALVAEVGLVVMTTGFIRAARVDLRLRTSHPELFERQTITLSLSHIWRIVAFAFPIGLIGLLLLSRLPGIEHSGAILLGNWEESSWVSITQTWAGLMLLALIYWYGFRPWLAGPMTIYLLIMSFQGYHRFRVIIPVLLLIQIFLDRRNLKWPAWWIVSFLFGLALIFYPLKLIGNLAQDGASVDEIRYQSGKIIDSALAGEAADQQFLDQFASSMALVDNNGRFFYGSIYTPLLVSPVPRPWWPDKPGLADHLFEISRPWRPMAETGMIVTYLGEAYANFGYVGVVLVPYLLGYWMARAYFRAYRSPYLSLARFTYLLVACNLVQVYRDGLMSIIVFTFVNMMPLMMIVMLHVIVPVADETARPGPRYRRPTTPR